MVCTGNDFRELESLLETGQMIERAAVTQVYCPSEGRTLDHGHDVAMVYGGTTIRQMKVVDTL
jgi:hypothetical protein